MYFNLHSYVSIKDNLFQQLSLYLSPRVIQNNKKKRFRGKNTIYKFMHDY